MSGCAVSSYTSRCRQSQSYTASNVKVFGSSSGSSGFLMETWPSLGVTLTVFTRLSSFSFEFIGRQRTTTCAPAVCQRNAAGAGRAPGKAPRCRMMGGRRRRGGVGGRTLTASAPELDAMMAPAVALSDGGLSTER